MRQARPKDEIRAFIAIELPVDIKRVLSEHIQHLRRSLPGPMRWAAPEAIHLTLKFLGNVPAEQVRNIVDALERASRDASPFLLSMGPLGCFPNPARARVVWLGLEGDTEALGALQSRIEQAMDELGFAREGRPFVAHLTLARARRNQTRDKETGRRLDEMIAGWQPGGEAFHVDGVSLMRSTLTPQGAVYERVARLGLGGAGN